MRWDGGLPSSSEPEPNLHLHEFELIETLPKDQRARRVWAPLADELREAPHLNRAERARVVEMINFSRRAKNITNGINLDKIVTDASMSEHLEYWIPEDKVLLEEKRASPRSPRKMDQRLLHWGGPPKKPPKRRRLNNLLWLPPD
jgi:hypothetical protein